jgi:hypothetical protein
MRDGYHSGIPDVAALIGVTVLRHQNANGRDKPGH